MSKLHKATEKLLLDPNNKNAHLPENWFDFSLDELALKAPIEWLDWPEVNKHGVEIGVKREDLLCPVMGGNKFYKLYYHLKKAKALGVQTILSFGGAYSNHIYALSAACEAVGLNSVGVVRGERPKKLSPTLADAESKGMKLHFVSRSDYKLRTKKAFLESLNHIFGEFYLVPEGGSDLLGAKGCMALMRGIMTLAGGIPVKSVCVATGSGGTLAGLIAASESISVHGFPVIKGDEKEWVDFSTQITSWVKQLKHEETRNHEETTNNEDSLSWHLHRDVHCGGYAKLPQELRSFIGRFEERQAFKLDPVYTAKLFYAVENLVTSGYWNSGDRIVLVHSGGLQGRRGFNL